jgi:hypothetical protein
VKILWKKIFRIRRGKTIRQIEQPPRSRKFWRPDNVTVNDVVAGFTGQK